MPRSIPELSVDTQALERLLLAVEIGGDISYQTMNKAIGRDVQNGARHILMSAVRRVQRDRHMVFAPVFGKGLKRLTDAGVLGIGEQAIAAIGRKSRRTVKKLACADYDKLTTAEKTTHNVLVSQLGALAHVTSGSTQKKLTERAGHEKLPVAKMLEAMQSSL